MNNQQKKNKDIIDCERYIAKMRLLGLTVKDSFFSNMDESHIQIKVNLISLAMELEYPDTIKIPEFASSILYDAPTDDNIDFNRIKNIKNIIFSDRITIDNDLVLTLRRFSGLKTVQLNQAQYDLIHKELGNKYKYDIK